MILAQESGMARNLKKNVNLCHSWRTHVFSLKNFTQFGQAVIKELY